MKLFVGEPDFLKGNWRVLTVRSVRVDRGTGTSEAIWRLSVSSNCGVFCVLSTATWDSEKQDVSLVILEDFPHVQVKKGIGLCCPGFYSF